MFHLPCHANLGVPYIVAPGMAPGTWEKLDVLVDDRCDVRLKSEPLRAHTVLYVLCVLGMLSL